MMQALAERRRAAAVPPPPLRVALRLDDPALAARLAALPGLRLVEEEVAEVVLAQAPGTGPGGLPRLVLAEGAAALAALRAGAAGALPPDVPAATLAAGLAAAARGLAVVPSGLLAGLAGRETPPPEVGLTRREREVLDLLAAGASNKVIARRLGLSFHTAKAHVAAVLQKLGAGSRADAVARGARAGLVLL
jgi:DNA-binding CsgD family transcriptional regulator